MDGQPWAIPPSMGCDEVWQAALNISRPTGHAPILELPTHPGVSYTFDYTDTLTPPVLWHPFHTLIATGNVSQVVDTSPAGDMRLYRARVP